MVLVRQKVGGNGQAALRKAAQHTELPKVAYVPGITVLHSSTFK